MLRKRASVFIGPFCQSPAQFDNTLRSSGVRVTSTSVTRSSDHALKSTTRECQRLASPNRKTSSKASTESSSVSTMTRKETRTRRTFCSVTSAGETRRKAALGRSTSKRRSAGKGKHQGIVCSTRELEPCAFRRSAALDQRCPRSVTSGKRQDDEDECPIHEVSETMRNALHSIPSRARALSFLPPSSAMLSPLRTCSARFETAPPIARGSLPARLSAGIVMPWDQGPVTDFDAADRIGSGVHPSSETRLKQGLHGISREFGQCRRGVRQVLEDVL